MFNETKMKGRAYQLPATTIAAEIPSLKKRMTNKNHLTFPEKF